MIDLRTRYLGIQLKNPIIVGSSGLSGTPGKIEKLGRAGAGAIVLKSVFEEQIRMEAGSMLKNSDYPEAEDYILNYSRQHTIDQYLDLIRQAKANVDIPIFGSINCITAGEWISMAQSVQEAGADGLELNAFFVPDDINEKSSQYEELYFKILSTVKKNMRIPVVLKLGQQFSHLPAFINTLHGLGSKGVVLFNRYYAPDINTDNLSIGSSSVFSDPSDMRETLRWVLFFQR